MTVVSPVPVNIGAGNTGASAATLTYALTLAAGAPIGATVYTSCTIRYLSTQPSGGTITDSRSNTYTLLNAGGLAGAKIFIHRSVLTTALVAGDTITMTFSANNADEILLIADALEGSASNDGSPPTAASMSNSNTHSLSTSAPTATDMQYGCDSYSGGIGPITSITNGTALGQTSTPANRGLVSFYFYPGVTSAVSTSIVWPGATHTGSMNKIPQVVTSQLRVPVKNVNQGVCRAAFV